MDELYLGPLVGGLAATHANLWGRATGPGRLYAWLGHRPDLSDARLAGQSLPLRPADGFAGVAPVARLRPDTRYHYALTLTTTPPPPERAPYPEFTTFPRDGTASSFNFAFGSCFRPANADGSKIFLALEARRRQAHLRFMLMLGDQIYADALKHNSLSKVACSLDDYRAVYAYTWSRPAFQQAMPNLPVFMTLDDHEVDDDWHWIDSERQWAHLPPWNGFERWLRKRPIEERTISRQRVQNALQAYWEHQAMHAPPYLAPPHLNEVGQYSLTPDDTGSLAYAFNYGAAAFFVLDTRTQRVRGPQEYGILGPTQWEALEKWLLKVKDTYPVKFLVTSSAVLFYMFSDFLADRWPGFPKERTRLLSILAEHSIRGVYLLTGDMHACHAIYAELSDPTGNAIPLWEFCSSAFEQQANWLAPYSYWHLRGKPVKRQVKKFCIGKNNFGVVRVNLDDPAHPRVTFEVYNEQNEMLAEAGESR